MIRHYEKIGLVPTAARKDSGYRNYGSDDVHRLQFIANARDLGFSITEISELLGLWQNPSRSSADVKALATARANELGRKADGLQRMCNALLDLAARCSGDDRPACPIIESLDWQPVLWRASKTPIPPVPIADISEATLGVLLS